MSGSGTTGGDRRPRELALAIWRAGLEAVRSDRLVKQAVRVEGRRLVLGDERIADQRIRRIVVVGAGKAGAGMAAGLEEALGPEWLERKQVTGWVNVPADCVRPLRRIHLHPARPPGVNEPTPEAARGAERILELAGGLGPDDLCLCLISGGGSALLPAPAEGVTLEDKLAVTRHLSAAGANIEQLNTVRKQLSRIKGGGLLRACRAGRLISLIISDVLGDPLDVIASGPTAPDSSTPQAALDVLEAFHAREAGVPERVFAFLRRKAAAPPSPPSTDVRNLVIGNNQTAVRAAAAEAERAGLAASWESAAACEGPAEDVGRRLAQIARRFAAASPPQCLVSGGEPVVKLAPPEQRGLGGRNQQLVLAAAAQLWTESLDRVALLSGGTDGEDGPTDAAGAVLDAELLRAARRNGLRPEPFLERNNAYQFFQPLDGLIITGPTHTNVCDVRVVASLGR